ncbi:MAG TPA: hypothetical protein DCK98_05945 [Chloroflexi bacterium]|jgi:hypothetical protein|nr:hypothetical protein [Chloroflexota bacterium]HAL27691.1 hypothetical protein [Chloroflexota bacterium]
MTAPRVAVASIAVTRAAPGRWKVRWRITNEGDALHLTQVAAPHGKFRSPDRLIDVALPPGGSFDTQLEIACAEPAGQEIENTFLILTAEAERGAWRILARMRIRVDADGVPHPTTERIDVQEVGFSGQR